MLFCFVLINLMITMTSGRPLSRCINGKLSDVYLELPSDSRHLYTNNRSPTPLRFDCQNVLEPKLKTALSQFYSTGNRLCFSMTFPRFCTRCYHNLFKTITSMADRYSFYLLIKYRVLTYYDKCREP